MKKLILLSVIVIAIVSCSKKVEPLPDVGPGYIVENLESMPYYADTLLLEKLEKLNLVLSDSVITIRPKKLLAMGPSQAGNYLNHHFIGITSGSYNIGENNLSAEILQFADEIKAYGYYSSFRSDGIKIEKIGTESFQQGNSRYMVKNDYVLILSVLENSDETIKIMRDYCIELDNRIIGSRATPPFFLLFPYASKIIPSQKYYPYQFLDIPGLDEVYTTSYLIGTDTMTLFLTMDQTGMKFKYLQQFARQSGNEVESLKKFSFDSTFSIAFKDSTYGVIVAGIKSNKLIGTFRYNPKTVDKHLTGWIKGLQ